MLKIALVEPFYGGSHKYWSDALVKHSKHHFIQIGLPARHWKWRMHASAISLASQIPLDVDMIVCSDMIDLSLFRSLLDPSLRNIPLILYFHENQLTYPWSQHKKDWDRNYAWINYTSCLAADHIVFNSEYNKNSFLSALPDFLKSFPDDRNLDSVKGISEKSSVLPVGLDIDALDSQQLESHNKLPVVLWNHRWEFDKNPNLFFETLFSLKDQGIAFELMVLGEQFKKVPEIFDQAKVELKNEIIYWGHVKDREEYIQKLWACDVLPVTSNHDFFGLSVLEAAHCNCHPILPNRLAYPEHFGSRKFFYNDDKEFVEMLKVFLTDFPDKQINIRDELKDYDWLKVILQYDDLLTKHSNQ